MTPVMVAGAAALYPAAMEMPTTADLERLLGLEASISARLASADDNPADVLAAGADVLDFAAAEERLFFPLLPLLDRDAHDELAREHEQMADDLQLLRHLVTTTPDSPDVGSLAAALARRLRAHIARDRRLLAQGIRLAGVRS